VDSGIIFSKGDGFCQIVLGKEEGSSAGGVLSGLLRGKDHGGGGMRLWSAARGRTFPPRGGGREERVCVPGVFFGVGGGGFLFLGG